MKFYGLGKQKNMAEEIAIGAAAPVEEHVDIATAEEKSHVRDDKETSDDVNAAGSDTDVNSLEKVPSVNAQAGVRKVEAVTLSWTKKELYIAYAWSVNMKIPCYL